LGIAPAEQGISVGGTRGNGFADHEAHGLAGSAAGGAEDAGDDGAVAGQRLIGKVEPIGGAPDELAGADHREGSVAKAGAPGRADGADIQVRPAEGSGPTVRVTVLVLVKLPEVPVMVTVAVPIVAALPAARVKVLAPVVLAGLKVAVTPLGTPEAVRLTLPVNPFCGVALIVLVPLAPWAILRVLGEADRLNCGGGRVIETLSKVAVVKSVLSLLLTAKPTKRSGPW